MVPGARFLRVGVLLAGIAILATTGGGAVTARSSGPCPAETVPTLSAQVPVDVCIPDGFSDVPMDYFDDFSWRTLTALIWPAKAGQRGVPDTGKSIRDRGPRVFETYKSLWEVFHNDGSAPSPLFNRYEGAANNPCAVNPKFGELVIGSFSGIDDIGQAGIGTLDPPLVAQNGNYVRQLTLFNQLEFDHVVKNTLYLRSHLPVVPVPRPPSPVLPFPNGSIAVKSAWIDVAGLPDALVRRFYTRQAYVRDPGGAGCSRLTMGLVGLHIATKTPSRPQWNWSSFEQEDNVPPARPNAPGIFTFNDGSKTPMPAANPLSLTPLASQPSRPFNVTRDENVPIHPMTVLMNYRYQALLKGTVWERYKLVTTQWPRLDGDQAVPVPASQDGSVPFTFPGNSAFSAFANVTMETFNQSRVQVGCMNCHNRARMTADFMWTILDHAYPPSLVPTSAGSARHP